MEINFSEVLKQVVSTVPIWGIVLAGLQYWLYKMKEFQRKEEERWNRIEQRIYNIEMSLASSGISDIKARLEAMQKAHVEQEMNVKALWRTIDRPERKSDV